MRFGVDARELAGRPTGVGRFLAGLLQQWAAGAAAPDQEFVLYTPEPLAISVSDSRFRTRVIPGSRGTWWEQGPLPAAVHADDVDVFFTPAYTAPLRLTIPIVAAIYDLSYFAHPEWFPMREGLRRRWLTTQTAQRARAVITLSDFSRREIVERLGVEAGRVHVIVPGIERLEVPPPTLTDPRVLFVGSIFNRRHVPELIHAVTAIVGRHPATSLDIVGDNRTFPAIDLERTIASAGIGARVHWHRYATDARLLELYGSARVFAFLSEYEGLGLTPLEALAAGVPPVLYDTPVARESCGDAALYVPVCDRSATTQALERALFDDGARAAILAAAPAVLDKYNWPRAARETLAVLKGAGASPG